MNLRETRIRKSCAPLECAPDCGAVRTFRVGRKIKNVSVAAGSKNDCIGQVRLDLSSDEIPGDNAARFAIDHDQIEHLRARKHLHFACRDLTQERLISAKQKLLPRLPASIERTRHLSAAEGAIGKHSPVLTCK